MTCSHYREKFSKLKELAAFPVQKIFLTATLPPRLEHQLKVETSMPESVTVIREPTDRPNLCYHVLHYNGNKIDTTATVVKLAHLLGEQFESDSRGIIFSRYIEEVDELARRFLECKNHSKMTSEDQMLQFERWRSGIGKWMVATTGLIHGIDYGYVDAIIFVGMPYGLMNFVQGAGRAGRKGRRSNVFMLHSSEVVQILPQAKWDNADETCLKGGDQYLHNRTECRRFVLTSIMDGFGIRCKDSFNSMHCDICDPESALVKACRKLIEPERREREQDMEVEGVSRTGWTGSTEMSRMRMASYNLWGLDQSRENEVGGTWRGGRQGDDEEGSGGSVGREKKSGSGESAVSEERDGGSVSMSILMDAEYAVGMRRRMEEKVLTLSRHTEVVKGHCVVCWAWKKKLVKLEREHKVFLSCREKGEYVKHGYGWLDFKKKMVGKLKKYGYCHNCGLPQGKFLPSSHPGFLQGKVLQCPLNDFSALVLWHIYHDCETWRVACEEDRRLLEIKKSGELAEWAGIERGGEKFCNGIELILWFMGKRDEGLL
jgi:hypothetical protein